MQRTVPLLLLALLILVQASLWTGRGGVFHLMSLRKELATQQAANEAARQRNERLTAEVADLKDGLEMVEEKARMELGMVRNGETLVVIAKSPINTPASQAVPVIPPPADPSITEPH
jgi:cell division protein FtsB